MERTTKDGPMSICNEDYYVSCMNAVPDRSVEADALPDRGTILEQCGYCPLLLRTESTGLNIPLPVEQTPSTEIENLEPLREELRRLTTVQLRCLLHPFIHLIGLGTVDAHRHHGLIYVGNRCESSHRIPIIPIVAATKAEALDDAREFVYGPSEARTVQLTKHIQKKITPSCVRQYDPQFVQRYTGPIRPRNGESSRWLRRRKNEK